LHEEGGLAGLMHHLMNFNLASVDVYTPPKTRALVEQKEESAPAHVQWWLETLERGTIRYPSDDPLDRGKILETDRVPWSGVVGVVDHRAIAGLRPG
jgi:hypothetical protein